MKKEDRLEENLRRRGGRMTEQRRVLLDTLSSVDSHPTAAELYEMVRDRLPDISQGTVYRNLRRLHELGYVQKLDYGPGASHFDATVKPHYHLRCRECECVIDLDIEREPVPGIERAQNAATNWEVIEHRVEFLGVCPKCRKTGIKDHEEGP